MLSNILRVIYPAHCYLCAKPQSKRGLCQACAHDLPLNLSSCYRCALPLPSGTLVCADCIQSPPAFDKVWSPFIYAQPLEWMIQQLKFNHKLYMAKCLAEQMWRHRPEQVSAECIVPMPLHPRRLRQRGFNQSTVIAQELSRLSGIPVDNMCQRRRNTQTQTGKTAAQRKRNIRGAFYCHTLGKPYRQVIILDDVMTTGSTVMELSKTLKQSGVEQVDVWSVARAERS